MADLNPCPRIDVSTRAAELRASGLGWDATALAMGLETEALRGMLDVNPKGWRRDLRRARKEVVEEAASEAILYFRSVLRGDDEKLKKEAAGHLIRLWSTVLRQPKPAKTKVVTVPDETMTPELRQAAEAMLAYQNLTYEEQVVATEKLIEEEERDKRVQAESKADRAALVAMDPEMRRQWYAGELFPFLPAREIQPELDRLDREREEDVRAYKVAHGIPADMPLTWVRSDPEAAREVAGSTSTFDEQSLLRTVSL